MKEPNPTINLAGYTTLTNVKASTKEDTLGGLNPLEAVQQLKSSDDYILQPAAPVRPSVLTSGFQSFCSGQPCGIETKSPVKTATTGSAALAQRQHGGSLILRSVQGQPVPTQLTPRLSPDQLRNVSPLQTQLAHLSPSELLLPASPSQTLSPSSQQSSPPSSSPSPQQQQHEQELLIYNGVRLRFLGGRRVELVQELPVNLSACFQLQPRHTLATHPQVSQSRQRLTHIV